MAKDKLILDTTKAFLLQKAIVMLTTGKRNKASLTAEEVIEAAKKLGEYVLVKEVK